MLLAGLYRVGLLERGYAESSANIASCASAMRVSISSCERPWVLRNWFRVTHVAVSGLEDSVGAALAVVTTRAASGVRPPIANTTA